MRPVPLPDPPLSDGTIGLRAKREADVPAIVAACQDPAIPRYTLVPSPYGEEDAHAFLAMQARRRADGSELTLAIINAPDDSLLGSIAARFEWEPRRATLGYWVAAPARGGGVAPRAAGLLAGWLLESLELARVEIRTHPDNVASQRVAEKAGFTREGVLRSYEEFKGERVDLVMFSRLPPSRSDRGLPPSRSDRRLPPSRSDRGLAGDRVG
jgi:RimJ/RimL family protein N-acetyltransferase